MNDPHSSMFAQLAAAMETLTPRDLHWLASSIMMGGAIVGLVGTGPLDTVNASWTLAGGIVGTGMAILWRKRGETVSIVAGRASCALLGGLCMPPLLSHYFTSLEALNVDPRLVFGEGALCSLISFLLGYAAFSIIQRRQNRIAEAAIKRISGKETQAMGGE